MMPAPFGCRGIEPKYPYMCYHAELGRSMSNCVDIRWEALEPRPLRTDSLD